MKKILVMFVVLGAMLSGTLYAQEGPKKDKKHRTEYQGEKEGRKERKSPEERANNRTEKMSNKFGLNKAQTKKLQALNLKHAREMEAMNSKDVNPRERGQKRGEEMKANRAKWEAELKDILTKEQYAQYEASRNERMQHRSVNRQEDRGKEFIKRREAKLQQRS